VRVALPGNRVVQAYGLSGFIPTDGHEAPDWGLYLDTQWTAKGLEWPHRVVDWPDFGLPADEQDAFDAFDEAHQRLQRGQLIDVACDGGTGRTGTALACIGVLAGVAVEDVVQWVRANYHPWAVEVPAQEELIGRFHDWWIARQPG
jgi:protein-tyrosine phosphatase